MKRLLKFMRSCVLWLADGVWYFIFLFFAVSASAQIIPADRRVDWSLAGHPNGIPTNRTTIYVNVQTTGNEFLRMMGDGVTDDTENLRIAIETCPSNEVVYLPAHQTNGQRAHYRITGRYISTLKSHFTLRGDGALGTNSIIMGDCAGSTDLFYHGSAETPRASNILSVLSGYTKDSTNIVLAGLDAVPVVGQRFYLDSLNEDCCLGVVTSRGAQGVGVTNSATFADPRGTGLRNQFQICTITAIANGTNITFWPPLYVTHLAARLPQIILQNQALECREIGFEGLTFTNKLNAHNFIVMNNSVNCWVYNCEFQWLKSAPILLNQCNNFEAKKVFLNRIDISGGDQSIYVKASSGIKVEDSIFDETGVLFESTSGSVVGYNLFTNTSLDGFQFGIVLNHGGHSYMNLVEGNPMGGYFQLDYYYGSSGLNTFFRNKILGSEGANSSNRKCLALDRNSLSNNVVGNVLGTSAVAWDGLIADPAFTYPYEESFIYRLGYPFIGSNGYADSAGDTNHADNFDPRVLTTILNAQNYNYFDNAVITNITGTLSNSLYLTGTPAWYGTNRFPSTDPNGTLMYVQPPAVDRYNGVAGGGSVVSNHKQLPLRKRS